MSFELHGDETQLEPQPAALSNDQAQIAFHQAALSLLQTLFDNREHTLRQLQGSRSWRIISSLRRLKLLGQQWHQFAHKLRRRLHISTESDVFYGALDSPAKASTSAGYLEVSGWVFSTAAPVTRVEAFLDDTFLSTVRYGVERRDVVAAYPSLALAECGYAGRIALDGLLGGRKQLTVRVLDAHGHKQIYPRSILIVPPAAKNTQEIFRQIEHALQEQSKLIQEPDELSPKPDRSKQEQDYLRLERDDLRRERDAIKIELESLNRFVPPGHFYSPIPSLDEVRQNDDKIFNHPPRTIPAIDLNESEQMRMFDVIKGYYDEIPFGPKKTDHLRYHFENPN